MKSIKWLFTLILVAMLALTACKSKQVTSADDPASNPRGDDTQPNNFGAENDSIDGTEGGEEVKDEAGEESVLDTEAMAAHLGDFVLRPDDMSHSYYVPDGGEQRKATIRLIQDMGEVEAKAGGLNSNGPIRLILRRVPSKVPLSCSIMQMAPKWLCLLHIMSSFKTVTAAILRSMGVVIWGISVNSIIPKKKTPPQN